MRASAGQDTLTDAAADAAAGSLLCEGDPAPTDVSGRYAGIHSASMDDAGRLAFSARLSGAAAAGGLFLRGRHGTRCLLRTGDATPAGGRYQGFSELDAASLPMPRGQVTMVLFRAEVGGGAAPEGLFLWTADAVRVVAMAGEQAPRGGLFRGFERPTLVAVRTRSGPGFELAYEAHLTEGGRAAVVHPSAAMPLATLAIGDHLGEDDVVDFSLSRMGGCLSCILDLRDRTGTASQQVGFLKHGLVLHGGTLRQGARFPSLPEVVAILGPPAVSLQLAIAAVRFADGTTGLATSDVLGNARLIARTGDHGGTEPGDPIDAFGPPVASSGFPLPSPVTVVAPVRLRSGRRALWRTRLSGPAPTGGDLLIPEHGATSPIKLANDGRLLLRRADGFAIARPPQRPSPSRRSSSITGSAA